MKIISRKEYKRLKAMEGKVDAAKELAEFVNTHCMVRDDNGLTIQPERDSKLISERWGKIYSLMQKLY